MFNLAEQLQLFNFAYCVSRPFLQMNSAQNMSEMGSERYPYLCKKNKFT